MGHRNPYRLGVNWRTGWIAWGMVGPDANTDNVNRGPQGHDEFNVATRPGNFGWPYFVGQNIPYNDYDFSTGESGSLFNPEIPLNESVNNTGVAALPPAMPALIDYEHGAKKVYSRDGIMNVSWILQGGCAMGGPFYHYNPNLEKSGGKPFPPYYDAHWVIYEWNTDWIKTVKLDTQGDLLEVNDFYQGSNGYGPIDVEFGPDGHLYVMEWGGTYQPNDGRSQLVRFEYTGDLNGDCYQNPGCTDPQYEEYDSLATVQVDDSCRTLNINGGRYQLQESLSGSGSFTIKAPGFYSIAITNIKGNLVAAKTGYGPGTIHFPEGMETGIYVIRVRTPEDIYRHKLLVR
jgi:hypothetical protein